MSEVWAARAISDCPDTRSRCFQAFIHLHVTAVGGFNSSYLQADPLSVRGAATGVQKMGGFQNDLRPVSDPMEFHALTGFSFDVRDAHAGDDINSFLSAESVEHVRDVLIFPVGQTPVPFNDGYSAAEAAHGLG